MSYALIDNASLTAIDRVTGRILVKNPDTINGDLVAFENVIQAILFYDNLICIDNYKPEHRDSRIKAFNYIRFLPQDDFSLPEIDILAKKDAQQIKPELRGGEFVDEDFKTLIEMLKLNMICTWDMRSSIYYLTLKMLGQPNSPEYEKYSELSASIFNELSDISHTRGRWSTDVKLVGSDGHHHTTQEMNAKTYGYGGITRPLEMFITSLNWLAYKSIYYSMAAKHLRADSFIHPIRHAYQIHWMKKTGAFGHDYTSRLIGNLSKKISSTTSQILEHGRSSSISMDLPIFSAWITLESGNIGNVINTALELKKLDHFTIARETIREIKISYDESGIATANTKTTKLINDLDKITGDLKRKFGVPSEQGIQGSFLIKSINSLTALAGIPPLPDKEFSLSTPEFMKSQRTKAFSTIFKDITNELTSVERLGGVRDLMVSSFNIDDTYYSPPKVEEPRYRRSSSSWKIPM